MCIRDRSTADDLTIATTSNTGITIRSGTGNDGNIYFSDGTSGSDEFRGYVQYGHSNNSLVFGTNAGERLRILSDGKTGIGTNSPTHKLQIQDTGAYLRLLNGHESDYDLRFMTQNSEANIWHYGTDDLTFGARYDRKVSLIQNGSKRLTINGDLIGINNTSPAKNLHVYASGVATLRIETGDSRGQAWDILSTNGAASNTGTLSFRDESGSSYMEFGANGGSPQFRVRNGAVSYTHLTLPTKRIV